MAVLSAAAQDLRWYKNEGPFDQQLSLEKMRSLLAVAVAHGHRALVLGAFGCGAFQHDPRRVAELFHGLLSAGGEFDGHFDVVLFGVIKSATNLAAFGARFALTTAAKLPSALPVGLL